MNKHDLNSIVGNYINNLQDALRETTLKREIGSFPVDPLKAFFVLLPLVNEEKNDDKLKQIILSLGSIHAALDVHDRIQSDQATSAEQQLTVLAGDHFSGIHYKVLAEIGEFEFIRELSQTIAHINEQKTALHHESHTSSPLLIERLTVIETGCISVFYETYDFVRYRELVETVHTYIRLVDMAEKPEHQAFQLDDSTIKLAIDLLQPKLDRVLEHMDFLQPVLQQAIQELVNPDNR
ncbi:heptaprenyl diphosphate synthase component 1 [Sporosarcina sp. A2]|uniref:heptaprenyl diphosphate synthase component 1 n=1 Tax=Sporosarcina sp. A2 TaxID=3393449 RepID=UPI003D7B7D26